MIFEANPRCQRGTDIERPTRDILELILEVRWKGQHGPNIMRPLTLNGSHMHMLQVMLLSLYVRTRSC